MEQAKFDNPKLCKWLRGGGGGGGGQAREEQLKVSPTKIMEKENTCYLTLTATVKT